MIVIYKCIGLKCPFYFESEIYSSCGAANDLVYKGESCIGMLRRQEKIEEIASNICRLQRELYDLQNLPLILEECANDESGGNAEWVKN